MPLGFLFGIFCIFTFSIMQYMLQILGCSFPPSPQGLLNWWLKKRESKRELMWSSFESSSYEGQHITEDKF